MVGSGVAATRVEGGRVRAGCVEGGRLKEARVRVGGVEGASGEGFCGERVVTDGKLRTNRTRYGWFTRRVRTGRSRACFCHAEGDGSGFLAGSFINRLLCANAGNPHHLFWRLEQHPRITNACGASKSQLALTRQPGPANEAKCAPDRWCFPLTSSDEPVGPAIAALNAPSPPA